MYWASWLHNRSFCSARRSTRSCALPLAPGPGSHRAPLQTRPSSVPRPSFGLAYSLTFCSRHCRGLRLSVGREGVFVVFGVCRHLRRAGHHGLPADLPKLPNSAQVCCSGKSNPAPLERRPRLRQYPCGSDIAQLYKGVAAPNPSLTHSRQRGAFSEVYHHQHSVQQRRRQQQRPVDRPRTARVVLKRERLGCLPRLARRPRP
mmetsp:Transcript_75134/g.151035  ORF Transcript_75134/g.151035 Transcript_75134/m.151035 type:complete len:203 (-) Transcript_75134:709-1317(-)